MLRFVKFCIDDLCFANTPTRKILAVCFLLGVSISLEKCEFDSTNFGYLGVNIDLKNGSFVMRDDKAEKLRSDIASLLQLNDTSDHFQIQFYLDRVAGKLSFYGLFLEQITSRSLASVSAKFRIGKISKSDAVNLISESVIILKRWDELLLTPANMRFDYRTPDLVRRCMPDPMDPIIFTDAGDNAGAAVTACGKFQLLRVFDESQKALHINSKEFFMVVEALSSSNLSGLYRTLHCRVDNKVALRWLESGEISSSVIRDREFVLSQMERFKDVRAKYVKIDFSYVSSR